MFKVNKNDVTDFVNFEHISHFFLTFLLLTSSMLLFAGDALNEFCQMIAFEGSEQYLLKFGKRIRLHVEYNITKN